MVNLELPSGAPLLRQSFEVGHDYFLSAYTSTNTSHLDLMHSSYKIPFGERIMKILVVCSTNRDGALSRMLANQAVGCYNSIDGIEAELFDMNELGADFLEPKAYKEPSEHVSGIVQRFLACDGATFIVPEYNGSYPGILKLFVDMLPYPEGFDKRPCAFIGLAAGQFQGLRAVEHFQQVTGYRNAYNYPRRLFIGDSYKQFDFKTGSLSDEELAKRLQQQSEGFVEFIKQVKSDA